MLQLPVPASTVIAEELDTDVCLYRTDTDEVLVLNQTAGDIWRLSDGDLSVAGIVATLARAYRQPEADLAEPVRTVVDDLEGRGYLVEAAPPAPSPPLGTD